MQQNFSGHQNCPKEKWKKNQEKDWGFRQILPLMKNLGRSAPQSQHLSCRRQPTGRICNVLIWSLTETVLLGNCTFCKSMASSTQWFVWFLLGLRSPVCKKSHHIPCRVMTKSYGIVWPVLVSGCTRESSLITPNVPLSLAAHLKTEILTLNCFAMDFKACNCIRRKTIGDMGGMIIPSKRCFSSSMIGS